MLNVESKSMQMKELFQSLGVNYEDMCENEEIDISDKNVKIKSFNHNLNLVEFKKVLSLVRKTDSKIVKLCNLNGDILIKGTENHRVYCVNENKYKSLKDINEKDKVINEIGQEIEVKAIKSDEISPILDIQVEDNENYFSNGILSHNTTTGGNALKIYCSIRMEVSKKEVLKRGEDSYGNTTKVKIVKNKVAPPFKTAEFDILFGKGISKIGCMVDTALACDMFKRKGTWYFYGDEQISQGRDKLIKILEKDPTLYNKYETELKKKLENIEEPLEVAVADDSVVEEETSINEEVAE